MARTRRRGEGADEGGGAREARDGLFEAVEQGKAGVFEVVELALEAEDERLDGTGAGGEGRGKGVEGRGEGGDALLDLRKPVASDEGM